MLSTGLHFASESTPCPLEGLVHVPALAPHGPRDLRCSSPSFFNATIFARSCDGPALVRVNSLGVHLVNGIEAGLKAIVKG
jgi:hypothetical protein